ncbi:hypothetical protein HaLaN_30747 [Haematococcus lacustris]|uniref:Uncharacterized protein n=1 Tax=Haematococcus lacustris TaxID=44745 RepID=A0A6A0AI13_HAELA|nr:hypothetical protein HaLaN_30747 [Haematococcus lacustris]
MLLVARPMWDGPTALVVSNSSRSPFCSTWGRYRIGDEPLRCRVEPADPTMVTAPVERGASDLKRARLLPGPTGPGATVTTRHACACHTSPHVQVAPKWLAPNVQAVRRIAGLWYLSSQGVPSTCAAGPQAPAPPSPGKVTAACPLSTRPGGQLAGQDVSTRLMSVLCPSTPKEVAASIGSSAITSPAAKQGHVAAPGDATGLETDMEVVDLTASQPLDCRESPSRGPRPSPLTSQHAGQTAPVALARPTVGTSPEIRRDDPQPDGSLGSISRLRMPAGTVTTPSSGRYAAKGAEHDGRAGGVRGKGAKQATQRTLDAFLTRQSPV